MGIALCILLVETVLLTAIGFTDGTYSLCINSIYALMLHSFSVKWSFIVAVVNFITILFICYSMKLNKDEKRVTLPSILYIWEGLVLLLLIFSIL